MVTNLLADGFRHQDSAETTRERAVAGATYGLNRRLEWSGDLSISCSWQGYLRRFLIRRDVVLKKLAELDRWRRYLGTEETN